MPTTQKLNTEELVNLTEHLKDRLESACRGSKYLSRELSLDLLYALDHLGDLALEASFSENSSAENFRASDTQASAAANSHSSISQTDLSQVVAEVVSTSLAVWQTEFTERFLKGLAVSQKEPRDNQAQVERDTLVLQELELELSDTRHQLNYANDQLAELERDLKASGEQLAKAFNRIADLELSLLNSSNDDDVEQLEQLHKQLEESQNDLADLREQNSELAAKLAHHVANSVTNSSTGRGNCEQISWEERKLIILRQLENDTSGDVCQLPRRENLPIQEIIDATQVEIARRDEEIDELREIIRMQSDAREGVAIGATGVAQLFDSDELVQQERQKLREIQKEWEDKLRQAEIDLSMERAKIARERIALEKQKEEISEVQINTMPKEKTIERRWLRILGIKENDEA